MTITMAAPWHKASFDHFLNESLPQLLAEQVPLLGYTVTANDQYTCQIKLTLASSTGDIEVEYTDLPQPDQRGIFSIKGRPLVVVPYAAHDDLEQAQVFCAGEQVYAHIQKRLGKAPEDLSWDESLAKAWLPLDLWISEFFENRTADGATMFTQPLDQTNWLASQSHVRRLYIKNRQHLFTPGHFGRACPFETPEGPNIGRIIVIALGAEIRDGRLIVVDERPEVALGLEAAMIPLLEHNDPKRLLMGTNMLRQWQVPLTPEPALIQSGNEPDAEHFWCGRNLLTAFISWGADTFEDGIVLSELCARKLRYEHPVEPGDKMSNRHGTKGIVSRILPDEEMPHLADGTAVELVYNFISLHARLSFGQIREALLSRIARTRGEPLTIRPFHAPDEQQIRTWLEQADLPADGMETLNQGRAGVSLQRPSTVGWVYWGRLDLMARDKIRVATNATLGQRSDDLDYYALRDAGAFENILERYNLCANARSDSATLAQRITTGTIEQKDASPQFTNLVKRLAAVGIRAEPGKDGLAFHLAVPEKPALTLARPLPHPWLRDAQLSSIGALAELPTYSALVEANTRLERVLTSCAPESLKQQAFTHLKARVQEFYAELLTPAQVHFEARSLFSGRAVLAPAVDLRIDQVGLAEEIAWGLFGPLVTREVGAEEVQRRSTRATEVLDKMMARSWVVVHRTPAFTPQTFIAFHPVRYSEHVIRLHPLTCRWLQADFDGDQGAVFLPLSEQAQQEAGQRLSVAANLTRTPELLKDLLPTDEALWGLAQLSLSAEGLHEISGICDAPVSVPDGIMTHAALLQALQPILQQEDSTTVLSVLERLMQRGFEVARASGASLSPFIGARLGLPTAPAGSERKAWHLYKEEVGEEIAARTDYENNDLRPQLLAVKSGAWGEVEQLVRLLSTDGAIKDINDNTVIIRHGYRAGLSPEEIYALAVPARAAFAQVLQEWNEAGREIRERSVTKSFSVLARAMRTEHPGLVFAHAAATGEIDPLTDLDSRLFVGRY